jgi:hypothetical protein
VGDYEVEDGWEIVEKYSFKQQSDLVGTYFAYKWTTGWYRGRVVGIERKQSSPDFGMYICKFVSETCQRCVALEEEDYDIDDIWITIKRK